MYFVFGCFSNMWCCSLRSCSKGGNLSGGRARCGNCFSSSHRSLNLSWGSKNGCGSAVWMRTGMPSSPALSHTGSMRGSSTGTLFPEPSITVIPRFL